MWTCGVKWHEHVPRGSTIRFDDGLWYVVWCGMIQEMRFVWAAMITLLLPGNTALIRCNSNAWYARRLRRDCLSRGTERRAQVRLSLSLPRQEAIKVLVR